MKKVLLSLLITTCFSMNFAYSQEKQPETTEKSGNIVAPSKEMQTILLAGQLAKFGYENISASALIQAAELYLSVATDEFLPVSAKMGVGNETSKDKFVSLDPKQILADATIFADGDPVYLSMIKKLENTVQSTRGAVGGPKRGLYRLPAGATDSFTIKFYANERATVVVSGDGDTDLDLYIYDDNGNLIAKDDDYSDDCIVNWIPRWTGQFIIQIVNRGNVYNDYVIATN